MTTRFTNRVTCALVTEPYDSLNFAPAFLSIIGQKAPMPGRVVALESRKTTVSS